MNMYFYGESMTRRETKRAGSLALYALMDLGIGSNVFDFYPTLFQESPLADMRATKWDYGPNGDAGRRWDYTEKRIEVE